MNQTAVLYETNALTTVPCPRVSVIIVTYGSENEIVGCIESLLAQPVPVELLLVDNASNDRTAEILIGYAERHQNVHIILNSENLGLAAANNCFLGKGAGDYILILNPDTVCRHDTLQKMLSFLDRNPEVAVVGPKHLYEDGKPHSSFHRSWGLFHVLLWRVLPYRFARTLYNRFSKYKVQDVLFVSGACLLIRRTVFEGIGGYDPEYFLTVEDACDLCIRARKTGNRVVFLPEAEVIHMGGRSGQQAPHIGIWHGCRGTVYHFRKHKGMTQALLVSLLLVVSSAGRASAAAAAGLVSQKYRKIARIYSKVFWNLLTRSPIAK